MESSKFMDAKNTTRFEDVTAKAAKDFDADKRDKTLSQSDAGKIPQPVPRMDRESDLDSVQYVKESKGEYDVLIPVDEYLDREAMKLGYGSYDEMLESGLSLAVPHLVDGHGMPIDETPQKDISEKAPTTSPERQVKAENTDKEDMDVAPKNFSDGHEDDEKISVLFGDSDAEKLFRDHENAEGQKSEAYVYYDYKKENKSDATERESGGGHDKQALKKSETSAGGGATFTASYSRNGTLKTDVKLNTGRNRTDSKGFVDKSLDFASKTERFVSMIPKDELMFDDAVDVAAISVLEHSASKHMEKKSRYKAIRKEAHRNVKRIRKEIAADETFQEVLPGENLEKAINSETLRQDEEAKKSLSDKSTDTSKELFNESNLKFTDETDRFSDPMEKRFTESVKYTESLSDSENNPGKKESSVSVAEENATRQVKAESDANKEFANKNVFEKESGESGTSGKNRSVDSYFNDDTSSSSSGSGSGSSSRFMTKEERLEQEKSKEKSAKKSEKKEVRKAATRAAVAKLIEAHKNLKSEIGDMSGQSSGDLLKDGTGGLLKTAASAMKNLAASAVKGMIQLLLSLLGTLLSALAGPLCIILLIVFIVFGLIAAIGSMLDFNSDSGTKNVNVELEYDDDYEADVEDDISTIMSELNANYPLMSYGQETAVWYALSKVGSAHDQTYHTEMSEDVFDSSSLAYRAYWYAGIDISYGGNYSAASEAEELIFRGRDVTDGTLRPGDLLFYGGSDNGKFAGIFHVAIYVGNINGEDKMVEARNDDTGVVYCDMRMENLVVVARPCDELPPPEETIE